MKSCWGVAVTCGALLACSLTHADLPSPSDQFIRHQPDTDTQGWAPLNLNEPGQPQPSFDSLVRPPGNSEWAEVRSENPAKLRISNIHPSEPNRPQFSLPGPVRPRINPAGPNRPQINPQGPNKSQFNPLRSLNPQVNPLQPGRPLPYPAGRRPTSGRVQANPHRSERPRIHPGWSRRSQFRPGQPSHPFLGPQGKRRQQGYLNNPKRYQEDSDEGDRWWNDPKEDIWFDPNYAKNHRWGDELATPKPGRWSSSWGDWSFITPGSSRRYDDPDRFMAWLASGGWRDYGHKPNTGGDPPWRATRRISEAPSLGSSQVITQPAAGAVGMMSLFVSTLTVLYMASTLMDEGAKTPPSTFQDVANSFWDLHGKIFGSTTDTGERQLQPEIKVLSNGTEDGADQLTDDLSASTKNTSDNGLKDHWESAITNDAKVKLVQTIDALINATRNASNPELTSLNNKLSLTKHNKTIIKDDHSRNKRSTTNLQTRASDVTGRQFDPISQIAISAGMVLGAYIGYSFINGPTIQNKKENVKKDFALRTGNEKIQTSTFSDDFEFSLPEISEEDLSVLIEAISSADETLNSTLLGTLLPKKHSTSDSLTAYLTSLKELLNTVKHKVHDEEQKQDLPELNISEPNLIDLLAGNVSITSTTSTPPTHTSPYSTVNYWSNDNSDEDRMILKVIPGSLGSLEAPVPVSNLSPYMTTITKSNHGPQNPPDLYSLVQGQDGPSIDPDSSFFHNTFTTPKPTISTQPPDFLVNENTGAYAFLKNSTVYFRPKIQSTSQPDNPKTENYSFIDSSLLGIQASTKTPLNPHVVSPGWISTTKAPSIDLELGHPFYHISESFTPHKTLDSDHRPALVQNGPYKPYTYEELNSLPDTAVNSHFVSSQRPSGGRGGEGAGSGDKKWQKIDTIPASITKNPVMQGTSKPSWPHYKKDSFSVEYTPTISPSLTIPFTIPGYKPPKNSLHPETSNQHLSPSYYMNKKYRPTQPSVKVHHKAEEGHVNMHTPSTVTNNDRILLRVAGSQDSYGSTHEGDHFHGEHISHVNTATTSRPFSVQQKFPKDRHQHHQQEQQHTDLASGPVSHDRPTILIRNHQMQQDYTESDSPVDNNDGNNYAIDFDPGKLLDKDTFTALLDLARKEWHSLQELQPFQQHKDSTHSMQRIRDDQYVHTTLSPNVGSSRPVNPNISPSTVLLMPSDLREIALPKISQLSSYTQRHRPQTVHTTPTPAQFPPDMHQSFDVLLQEILADMNKAPAHDDTSLPDYLDRYITKRKLGTENEEIGTFKQNLRLLFEIAAQNGILKGDFLKTLSNTQEVNRNTNSDHKTLDVNQDNQKTTDINIFQQSPDTRTRPQHITKPTDSTRPNAHESLVRPNHPPHTDRPFFASAYNHLRKNEQESASRESLVTWSSLTDDANVPYSSIRERSTPPPHEARINWDTRGNLQSHFTISRPFIQHTEKEDLRSSHPGSLMYGELRTRPSQLLQYESNTPSTTPSFASLAGFSSYLGRPSSLNFPSRNLPRPKKTRILDEQNDKPPDSEVIASELKFERTENHETFQTSAQFKDATERNSSVVTHSLLENNMHPVAELLKEMLKSASYPINKTAMNTANVSSGQNSAEELEIMDASSNTQNALFLPSGGPVSLEHRNKEETVKKPTQQQTFITNIYSRRPTTTDTPTTKPGSRLNTPAQFTFPTQVPTYTKQYILNQPLATPVPFSSLPSVSFGPFPSSTPSSPFLSSFPVYYRPSFIPSQSSSHPTSVSQLSSLHSPHPISASHSYLLPSPTSFHSNSAFRPTHSNLNSHFPSTSSPSYYSNIVSLASEPNSSSPHLPSLSFPASFQSNSASLASHSNPTSPPSTTPSPSTPGLMSKFLCRHAEHHQACVVCIEEVGQRAECLMRRP